MTYDQAAASAKSSGGQVAYRGNDDWYVVSAQQSMSAGPIGPTNWDEVQRNTMAGGMAAGSTRERTPTAPRTPSATSGATSQPWMRPPTQSGMGGADLFGTATWMLENGTPLDRITPLFGNEQALGSWLNTLGPYQREDALSDMQRRANEDAFGVPEEEAGPRGGWDIAIPYGLTENEIFTLSNGATGFFKRDSLGWPEWVEMTPGTEPISEIDQAQLDMMNQQADMDWQQFEAQMAMQEKQLASEDQWRQSQMDLYNKQYGAQLAAQPHSWLEYSAFTGETPVVQPWMQPLSSGDYPQLQAGQEIPGYSATDMTGMPDLLRPSRQYQARMGPTAEQQWLGYQQADQGAIPEETLWRQQSAAPPSGRFAGLSRRR